jgi:hypothetical protein
MLLAGSRADDSKVLQNVRQQSSGYIGDTTVPDLISRTNEAITDRVDGLSKGSVAGGQQQSEVLLRLRLVTF